MPLTRDLNGDFVPLGKTTRTRVADLLDGALPSWLQASAGTASFSLPSASHGYAQFATGATLDSTAVLQTTQEFDSRYFRGIALTVQSFYMDVDASVTPRMTIGSSAIDPTRGVGFYQQSSLPILFGTGASSVTASVPYQLRGQGEGLRRRNLTLLWLPHDYEAYLLTDDQVISFVKGPQLDPFGLCRASVSLQTKQAVSHYFRVSQVRLDLIHN